MGKSILLSFLMIIAIAVSGAFSGFEVVDQVIGCQLSDGDMPATTIQAGTGGDLEADFYAKIQGDWTELDPADYEVVSSNKEILLAERGEDGQVFLHFLDEGQTQLTVVYGEDIKSLPVFSRPPVIAFYSDTKISADARITEFTFDETNRTFYALLDKDGGYGFSEWSTTEGGELVEMDSNRFNEGIIQFVVHDDVTSAFTLKFWVLTDGSGGEKNCECLLQCNPA